MGIKKSFWNYFQECHIKPESFDRWVFNMSLVVTQQQFSERILPDIVLNRLDRKEILRIPSTDFLLETNKELPGFPHACGNWINFPYINPDDSMRTTVAIPHEDSKNKADINVILYDSRTHINCGSDFSIKSHLGDNSTLLKACDATNFTYRIEGHSFTDEEIENINAINTSTKIIDCVKAIWLTDARIVFEKVDNETFCCNLIMIDTNLVKLMAYLFLEQVKTGNSLMSDLSADITKDNPLDYEDLDMHPFYSYKLKHFLTSAALGMTPSKTWDGEFDAIGGFLVITKDNEILCYHLYNFNSFEDFLFQNAYLELINNQGENCLYRGDDGNVYFKLNFQIKLK